VLTGARRRYVFPTVVGTLGSTWFVGFTTLKNADYVLTTRGTAPPCRKSRAHCSTLFATGTGTRSPSLPDTASHTNDVNTLAPDSSLFPWDKSKVVALQPIGAIMRDFLMSKIIHLPSFGAGETFVTHIRDVFLLVDRAISVPELRCLERALRAIVTVTVPSDTEALRPSLVKIWEKMWVKCGRWAGW
jgi:hypothetical protein